MEPMDHQTPVDRLDAASIRLPAPPRAVGSYLPVLRAGDDLFVSGQLPMRDGQLVLAGRVGDEISLEAAYEAARLCAINALALLDDATGSQLERVQLLRVGGFVASAAGFVEQPKVVNGASDLFVQILGDRGRHARAAVGVSALPLGAPVEIEVMARILP